MESHSRFFVLIEEGRTYDLQVVEMGIDIAASGERSRGSTPVRRVRITTGNIRRDVRAGEEPDINTRRRPFGGVDAAVGSVEAVAVRLSVGAEDAAASVGRLARSLDVAVACLEGTGKAGVVDRAAIAGVQGHLVNGLGVDALDNVDFAVVRPV